jgi:hypothetical protein
MKIQIYIAIAKHEDEEVLLGVGTNRRLVEIQRDSFMGNELHLDWKAQTQIHDIDVIWEEMVTMVTEPAKEDEKNAIRKEKTVSNK